MYLIKTRIAAFLFYNWPLYKLLPLYRACRYAPDDGLGQEYVDD